MAGGFQITESRGFVRRSVGWRYRKGAAKPGGPIQIGRSMLLFIGRKQAGSDPQLPVLLGQRPEIRNRRKLVAVDRGGIGKSGGELVLPLLAEPGFGRSVGDLFELPG